MDNNSYTIYRCSSSFSVTIVEVISVPLDYDEPLCCLSHCLMLYGIKFMMQGFLLEGVSKCLEIQRHVGQTLPDISMSSPCPSCSFG